jgi:hypothetical protein
MSLSRRWCGACAAGFRPCHYFEIENKYIVVEFVAIPSAEHEHLRPTDQVRSVIEPGGRRAATLRALVPRHGDRVEGVQVPVHGALGPLPTEDDDA